MKLQLKSWLPNQSFKTLRFVGAIFSYRATTSGIPFSFSGVRPLRFRIVALVFVATRRVLEGLERVRSSCRRNVLYGIHSVVRRRIQGNIAWSSPFSSFFLLMIFKGRCLKNRFRISIETCCAQLGMKNLLTI